MNRIFAVIALFAAVAGQAAHAGCVVSRLAELPVTMSELRPYVHAKVNGSDLRLLADSGAFYSVISPGTAAELKLSTRPAPAGFYMTGVGGATDVRFTTAKDFVLDTIPLHNIDFIVGGSEIRQDLGGVLGRNVLSYVDTEYDLANSVIRLMRPVGCGARVMAYWAAGKPVDILDMEFDAQKLPPVTVPVVVNGVRLRATLDTGAQTSVLMLAAAKRSGVPTTGAELSERGMSGGIGRRMVGGFVAPLESIKIGDEEIKHTKIRVIDNGLRNTDMLLGADFFLSHRVFVAKSQQKVYVTYNGGPVFSLVAQPINAAPPSTAAAASSPDAKPQEGEPADAAGFSRRGEVYASRRDFAHAIVDLDKAVELAPTNADYVYQRAVLRLRTGQPFLAMADIEQTLKLRPNDQAAHLARAQLRFNGRDQKGALADLDEVATSASPAADARFALGMLYERGESPEQALAQFNLWIAAHPDDNRRPQALNGRCWSRALLNRELDKALADCNGALRANPKVYSFLDSRGLVFLRRGEFARSIVDYDASLALRPKVPWSLYGRGIAKMKAGDADGGKADVAAALASNANIATEAAKYGVKP